MRAAYSIPEVCEQTSLPRTAIYSAIAAGRLTAKKLGKRTLVTSSDLDRFLQSLPSAATKSSEKAA